MRVLLVGEFSGFFYNLKKGLQENGVECHLISNSDFWKKIEGSDFALFNSSPAKGIRRFYNIAVEPFLHRRQFAGYDVVQFVNPIVYSQFINTAMFSSFKKRNKKIFISIAGDCYSVYKAYKEGAFDYYIYDNNPEICVRYEKGIKSFFLKRNENRVLSKANGIIPIMHEYAVGVKNRNNTTPIIPIPFDFSAIKYEPNTIIDNKVVIMHGIIREKTKGSEYIIEALQIVKKRHPDDVDVIIDGKKPLSEYLKQLYKVNILIDQCKENCYGMNALYAMAEGRIVLGGATRQSLEELGVTDCPVINIEPNVDQIVSKIELLLKRKNEFQKLGEEGRKYVETVHNYKTVASRYIDLWNKF